MAGGLDYDIAWLGLRPTSWNDLPPAAQSAGRTFFCPDAPGGGCLVLSNGSAYRTFARGGQVKPLVSDASGRCSWTFDPPFAAPPVPVALAVNTLTRTGVVFLVKRAVLVALGQSIFSAAAPGVTIQAMAFPSTT